MYVVYKNLFHIYWIIMCLFIMTMQFQQYKELHIWWSHIIFIEFLSSDADDVLKRLRFEEHLDSRQVVAQYSHSLQYIIPRNQEKIKQHALILYREDGARGKADSFSKWKTGPLPRS